VSAEAPDDDAPSGLFRPIGIAIAEMLFETVDEG